MSDSDTKREHYRVCSICRTPIPFGATYYKCSVSTCNRKRTALHFCSVACWDAHVPTMRHRDAWAEEVQAPTLTAWLASEQQRVAREESKTTRRIRRPGAQEMAPSAQRSARGEHGDEVLVVVSKVKAYIKERSGLRTSDGVMAALSDVLRDVADEAIRRAEQDERQTVMDRDVPRRWRPG
jgi:hypothetical protein